MPQAQKRQRQEYRKGEKDDIFELLSCEDDGYETQKSGCERNQRGELCERNQRGEYQECRQTWNQRVERSQAGRQGSESDFWDRETKTTQASHSENQHEMEKNDRLHVEKSWSEQALQRDGWRDSEVDGGSGRRR